MSPIPLSHLQFAPFNSEGLCVFGIRKPGFKGKKKNPPAPLNRVYPVQLVYDSVAYFTGVPFQGVQLGCNPRNLPAIATLQALSGGSVPKETFMG